MIGIYKITNILNNKCYIGQSTDIEQRWRQHKISLQTSNKSWYPQARKESNSINDFSFEILQICQTDELDELEEWWINEYDAYQKGYNQTPDGTGINTNRSKIIYLPEKNPNPDNFYKAMRDLNGNDYKLYHFLCIQSLTKSLYYYSVAEINSILGLGANGGTLAFNALIKKKYIIQNDNNSYSFYYTTK